MAKILIVDDDLGYLNALAEGLTALGHAVSTARSGLEAKEWLETGVPDIAILDMIMEGGGAISLVHDFRTKGLSFPIIVVTGRAQIADSPVFRHGIRDAGAKIQKTATLAEINQLIGRMLKPQSERE